ncbi:hypothetical protein RZS08_28320, partial [Arthrospira platensis SPKY1]|nr:hypothetical protein [Arthrospira platensis SPKY1]
FGGLLALAVSGGLARSRSDPRRRPGAVRRQRPGLDGAKSGAIRGMTGSVALSAPRADASRKSPAAWNGRGRSR